MSRKRRAGIIAAGVAVLVLIVLVAVVIPGLTPPLPPEVTPEPELVTLECTDRTATSLQARGEVEDTCIGPLSTRGFVYMEGVEGDSAPAVIPLANPYFERAIPLQGWAIVDELGERSSERAKLGAYSLKQHVPEDARARVGQYVSLDISEGDRFTAGAWVWCDTPNTARINLFEPDVINVVSAFHPGDSQWHFLTVTGTAAQDAGRLMVILSAWRAAGPAYIAYYDGVVLFRGSAVFEHGQFSEGTYSLTIDNLEPDTSYSIRAFGQSDAGVGYGDVVDCLAPEPALITLACTDVTAGSLTARGEVEDIGIGLLSTRGFAYTEETGDDPEPAIITLENASFELGDPPHAWDALGDVSTLERSQDQVKVGDYSARVTRGTDWGFIRQSLRAADFRGTQVTLGAWVYVPEGSAAIYLQDSEGTTATSITTTGQWIWATVTRTFDSEATFTQVRLQPGPNRTAYFDRVILVEGCAVFDHGQFAEGPFSLTIDNLDPDTRYTVRAFGVNEGGSGQGAVVTCETPAGP